MSSPILLCTDGSELSIAALRAGIDLLGPDHAFVAVTVMDEPDPMLVTGTGMAGGVMSPVEFDLTHEAAVGEARGVIAATLQSLGLADVETHILQGSPGAAVCQLADELSARAIVLGSRGRGGLKRAVLGSVSDHVVRHARCPVIVAGPEAAGGQS